MQINNFCKSIRKEMKQNSVSRKSQVIGGSAAKVREERRGGEGEEGRGGEGRGRGRERGTASCSASMCSYILAPYISGTLGMDKR